MKEYNYIPKERSKKHEKYRENYNTELSQKKQILSIKKLISNNKLTKALSEVEKFLQQYPDNSFGLFQQANILYMLNECDIAKRKFQYIIDQNMESRHSALYKLGVIARKDKNYDQAYELFYRNVQESPYDEIFSIIMISKIELERGDYDKAQQILEDYADMNNENVILQQASILQAQGKLEEGYQLISTHDFSGDPVVEIDYLILKGAFETELKRYEDAETTYQKILATKKTNKYYKGLVGYAYMNYERGNYQEVINQCSCFLVNGTGEQKEKAMLILGHTYRQLNQFELAEEYYLEAKKYSCTMDNKACFYLGELKN